MLCQPRLWSLLEEGNSQQSHQLRYVSSRSASQHLSAEGRSRMLHQADFPSRKDLAGPSPVVAPLVHHAHFLQAADASLSTAPSSSQQTTPGGGPSRPSIPMKPPQRAERASGPKEPPEGSQNARGKEGASSPTPSSSQRNAAEEEERQRQLKRQRQAAIMAEFLAK